MSQAMSNQAVWSLGRMWARRTPFVPRPMSRPSSILLSSVLKVTCSMATPLGAGVGSIGGWAVAVGRGVGLIATWDAPDGAQPAPSATAIASTVSVSLPTPLSIHLGQRLDAIRRLAQQHREPPGRQERVQRRLELRQVGGLVCTRHDVVHGLNAAGDAQQGLPTLVIGRGGPAIRVHCGLLCAARTCPPYAGSRLSAPILSRFAGSR